MGGERRSGLARLMLRWPERRAELQNLADADPVMGDLCEAYELACAAVDYWERAGDGLATDRALEYRALVKATEDDILSRIH